MFALRTRFDGSKVDNKVPLPGFSRKEYSLLLWNAFFLTLAVLFLFY